MFVTFIGNPRDTKDTCGQVTYAGVTFQLNREVEVDDTAAMAKLRKNGHFVVRDGDVKTGGGEAKADTKAELIAFAEKHGVKVDKRWSEERIAKAIDEAAAAASQAMEDDEE